MSKPALKVTMTMMVDGEITVAELQGLIDNKDFGHIVNNLATDIHVIQHDENPLDQPYRDAATEKFADEGQIEIDSDALVSYGEDDGAYVQAWVWVESDLVPNVCNGDGCEMLVRSGDTYFGSPCGTYCEPCMHAHAKACGICASEFGL